MSVVDEGSDESAVVMSWVVMGAVLVISGLGRVNVLSVELVSAPRVVVVIDLIELVELGSSLVVGSRVVSGMDSEVVSVVGSTDVEGSSVLVASSSLVVVCSSVDGLAIVFAGSVVLGGGGCDVVGSAL